jgi:hypothetical protein
MSGGFLPASSTAAYRGSKAGPIVLGLLGLGALIPGLIHYALPDGGAGVIGGLDLTRDGPTIVRIFAWMGSTQIPWGIALIVVAVRYQALAPLFLSLALLERVLAAGAAWVLKPTVSGHHPPEHFAVLVGIPIIAVALALSLRRA